MRIVIDTNVYLNFYRMSKQSLTSLTSLIKLIKTKKIELILPKQIEDEFYRDKNIVSRDFISNLKKLHVENKFYSDKNITSKNSELNIEIPTFLRSYRGIKKLNVLSKKLKKIEKEKIKSIKNINEKLEKIKKDILLEHNKRISNPKSEINFKIKQIFDLAIKPIEDEKILQKAYFRTLRGNPPRKNNNSFGDAIIWETVLENYSDKKLVIISGDSDFSSETNKEKINEFLEREWKNQNEKEIKLFTNFGEFINSFTRKHTVKDEIIEEEKRVSVMSSSVIKSISDINYSNIINSKSVIAGPVDSLAGCVSVNGLHTCSVCGKSFKRDPGVIYQNECPDCRYSFIAGVGTYKICDVCQKSYYGENTVNSLGILENKCPECRNKSFQI